MESSIPKGHCKYHDWSAAFNLFKPRSSLMPKIAKYIKQSTFQIVEGSVLCMQWSENLILSSLEKWVPNMNTGTKSSLLCAVCWTLLNCVWLQLTVIEDPLSQHFLKYHQSARDSTWANMNTWVNRANIDRVLLLQEFSWMFTWKSVKLSGKIRL